MSRHDLTDSERRVKLKHFRRVATRCDKLAANCLAMIQLHANESTAYGSRLL